MSSQIKSEEEKILSICWGCFVLLFIGLLVFAVTTVYQTSFIFFSKSIHMVQQKSKSGIFVLKNYFLC